MSHELKEGKSERNSPHERWVFSKTPCEVRWSSCTIYLGVSATTLRGTYFRAGADRMALVSLGTGQAGYSRRKEAEQLLGGEGEQPVPVA